MLTSNQNHHIDDLIARFLSGEATRKEQEQLLQWIESDDDHKAYYEKIREVWLSSAQAGTLPAEKVEQALQQTNHKINQMSVVERRRQFRKMQKRVWPRSLFKYAAALVLLAVTTYALTQYSMNHWLERQSSEMVYEAHYGSRGYAVLPDNSKVWLNSGSKLSFHSGYNLRERSVQLTGEAYFEVQTNPDKPFVVKAGNLSVKATGTVFNVKAYPEEDRITTTLIEGIVTIEGVNEQQKAFALKVTPSQSISYYKDRVAFENEVAKNNHIAGEAKQSEQAVENKPQIIISAVVRQVKTEVHTSWMGERWMIDNQTFGSLAVELERRYDVKIQFDSEELKKYRFTGTIERETLEQMFDVFKYSIPLQFTIEHGTVTLTVDEYLKKRYEKAWKQNQSNKTTNKELPMDQ